MSRARDDDDQDDAGAEDDDAERPRDAKGDMGEDDESLPFDVEVERIPTWAQAASFGVIVVAIAVALKLVGMFALLPFLVASSLGRRFVATSARAVVDASGLSLDDRLVVPRGELGDVWLDDDEREARVVITRGSRLFVLWFVNRDQAKRCADALGPGTALVAGHRPVPLDLLASLRFVAIAAGFFATKDLLGFLPLAFAAPGIVAFLRGRQIVVTKDGFELRSFRGVTAYRFSDVHAVDDDKVAMRDGRTLAIGRGAIRDALLASPPWTGRAHRRALKQVAAGANTRAAPSA